MGIACAREYFKVNSARYSLESVEEGVVDLLSSGRAGTQIMPEVLGRRNEHKRRLARFYGLEKADNDGLRIRVFCDQNDEGTGDQCTWRAQHYHAYI